MRKLQRKPGMIDKCDEIIQEQLTEGIVERVAAEPNKIACLPRCRVQHVMKFMFSLSIEIISP